jgi:chaperonin GroES
MSSAFRRLIPTLNRIVVKKIEVENKTKSGIILTQKEEPVNIGEVIAVGPGKKFIQKKKK